MKLLLLLPLLMLSFGCAQNYFNVPTENFADKVKVLGVAPIFVDSDSEIKFPRKDQLISLISDMNRKYEQQFVRKIKATGNFFTVALLDGDAQQIFSNLFFRREKRDDATIQYNKYFWKIVEIQDYIRKNNLDAVMLVTVSGISKTDKVFTSNLPTSISSDYNLIMTAQILDANGTVLWEYPNFRSRHLTYYPMINLQYPDFSEAEANLSDVANIKFKTIDGIRLTLEQKRKDLLLRETQESVVYGKQFDEILSFIRYDSARGKKGAVAPAEPVKPYQAAKPLLPTKSLVKTPVKAPEIPEQPVVAPVEDSMPAK